MNREFPLQTFSCSNILTDFIDAHFICSPMSCKVICLREILCFLFSFLCRVGQYGVRQYSSLQSSSSVLRNFHCSIIEKTHLDLRQASTSLQMSFKSTLINSLKELCAFTKLYSSHFYFMQLHFMGQSVHFAEHHNRNLISVRGMKITLEYIVNLLLLGSFHLTYSSYQSLTATLLSYCISLPYASTLSEISAYTVSNKQHHI